MQETEVQSLGQEEPLEKGITTHSRNFAWRILWIPEGSDRLQSLGSQSQTWLSNFDFQTFKSVYALQSSYPHTPPPSAWAVGPQGHGTALGMALSPLCLWHCHGPSSMSIQKSCGDKLTGFHLHCPPHAPHQGQLWSTDCFPTWMNGPRASKGVSSPFTKYR